MLTCLSSTVTMYKYMRSPCIFLLPGGGFQPLMVKTFRHCMGCRQRSKVKNISKQKQDIMKESWQNLSSLTFQSLFCGWRRTKGRSLLPGRMCSGGVQSICSSSLPFFLRFPVSAKASTNRSLNTSRQPTRNHLRPLNLPVTDLQGLHLWRHWGTRGSCSPLHYKRLMDPGSSAGLWCDGRVCELHALCRALRERNKTVKSSVPSNEMYTWDRRCWIVPSTTLRREPSCRPSMDLSSAKLSSTLPSSCKEKQVRWQVSSRSIRTWWISCTISCGDTWEGTTDFVTIFGYKCLCNGQSVQEQDSPEGQRVHFLVLGSSQWSQCLELQSLPVRLHPLQSLHQHCHPAWSRPPQPDHDRRPRSLLRCQHGALWVEFFYKIVTII